MSDIEKVVDNAIRDAVDAADNAEMVRQIAAILAAQQLLNAQQQPVQQVPQRFSATQWLVVGGVVVSVGLVVALFAVAVAIGACCATVCLLVLRSLYRDFQKGK